MQGGTQARADISQAVELTFRWLAMAVAHRCEIVGNRSWLRRRQLRTPDLGWDRPALQEEQSLAPH
jgi:hypothetical protein